MEKPLNINEPVQTRDGRKARIICTDKKGDRPIVAVMEDADFPGEEVSRSYLSNGRYFRHGEMSYDLINVPRRIKGWVNVYGPSECSTYIYPSKEQADACAYGPRVGCIYVDFPEGEGL